MLWAVYFGSREAANHARHADTSCIESLVDRAAAMERVISDNPETDEGEPEMRIDAMHHAREPQGMQTTLWFMLFLLENYGSDPLATYLVNEREMYFVPCVNPDGYEYNRINNPNGGGMWRKNRRDNGDGTFGVDLNRNYKAGWTAPCAGSTNSGSDTYKGPSAGSEPEPPF